MSEKMTCPACNAHLSSVLRAFDEGEPCPECGLSAESAAEVIAARRRNADEKLTARLAEVLKERDQAVAEARLANQRMQAAKRALEGADDW